MSEMQYSSTSGVDCIPHDVAPGLETNLEILRVCNDSYRQDRMCRWVGSVRHKIGFRVF